jgi:hypothetical protein
MRAKALLAWLALGLCVPVVLGQAPAPLPPTAEPGHAEVLPQDGSSTEADSGSGPCLWAEADYIIYWLKPVCLKPPTLSIGDLSDAKPGVPGQPGTLIVQGGHKFEFGGADGLRPRLGAWLTDDHVLGVEAEGFVLEQVAAGQAFATVNGRPATFIVFQNPDNSSAALPFSIPGVVNGSSAAVATSRLWGLEANLISQLDCERFGWGLHSTFLAGWRYLNLDDRVDITNRQSLLINPQGGAIGEADFNTQNQFIGGQVGARFGATRGNLGLDLTTKLALGEAHLASNVAGGPLLAGSSVLPPLVPGPVLALPSNLGRLSSDRIAVVPEVNFRIRWQVREHVQLTLGYNLLYWNKVLCPGDQMDPHANLTQLPFRGPVVGAPVPAHQFVFTDAFAHGLQVGVAFSY